jgi:hypothetical protein
MILLRLKSMINKRMIFSYVGSLLLLGQPATAQQSEHLENLLNTLDKPSVWAATPVSGIPPSTSADQPLIPSSGSPLSLPYPVKPISNNAPALMQSSNPFFTRQQILRILLGGSTQSTNPHKNSQQSSGSSSTYSDYQEAENQASRAHDAEERAHYEKDKGIRQDDASQAYYAANAARDASDRVYQASLNGDATGKQYAGAARDAADRARADANQARYYADTDNQ